MNNLTDALVSQEIGFNIGSSSPRSETIVNMKLPTYSAIRLVGLAFPRYCETGIRIGPIIWHL